MGETHLVIVKHQTMMNIQCGQMLSSDPSLQTKQGNSIPKTCCKHFPIPHVCICNIFVKSHPLCPKWAAATAYSKLKSIQKSKLWVPSQHTSDPPVFRQQSDIICKFSVFRQISVRPNFESIAFQLLLYADVQLMQNIMPWSVPNDIQWWSNHGP